jgi:hypothetical protein
MCWWQVQVKGGTLVSDVGVCSVQISEYRYRQLMAGDECKMIVTYTGIACVLALCSRENSLWPHRSIQYYRHPASLNPPV